MQAIPKAFFRTKSFFPVAQKSLQEGFEIDDEDEKDQRGAWAFLHCSSAAAHGP